jgi:putative transposase
MPEYARKHQLTESLTYHVFNRSNAKVTIFRCDQDYDHFMKVLIRYMTAFGLKIYHWAIMPTHYHLLLEIGDPERLSKAIGGIALAYTQYFHKKYNSCGFLWQGRFKSQPVQKECYMITCGRYIDRNPVKAELVTCAELYSYSSARFYCLGIDDGITTPDPFYATLAASARERQIRYGALLRDSDGCDGDLWEDSESPQGDPEFVRKIIKCKGRFSPRRRGGLQERKSLQIVV